MADRSQRAYWIEVAGLAIAAVLFFRSGLLMVAFLIPIQVCWVRRGEKAGLLSSGIFLGLLTLFKVVDYVRIRSLIDGFGLMFLILCFRSRFWRGSTC